MIPGSLVEIRIRNNDVAIVWSDVDSKNGVPIKHAHRGDMGLLVCRRLNPHKADYSLVLFSDMILGWVLTSFLGYA